MSEIKNGGLDQYGAGCFGRLVFFYNQKQSGTERVNRIKYIVVNRISKMRLLRDDYTSSLHALVPFSTY